MKQGSKQNNLTFSGSEVGSSLQVSEKYRKEKIEGKHKQRTKETKPKKERQLHRQISNENIP
jgi:hypothetical protein